MSAQATQNDDLIILSDNVPSSFDASNPVIPSETTQTTEESNPIISFDANQTDNNLASDDNIIINEQTPVSGSEPVISLSEDNNLAGTKTNSLENLVNPVNDPNSTNIDLNLNTENTSGNDLFNLTEVKEPNLELKEDATETPTSDSGDLFINSEDSKEKPIYSENNFDFGGINISGDLNKSSKEEDVLSSNGTSLGLGLGLGDSQDDSLDMDSILDNTIEKLKKRQDGIDSQKSSKQQIIDDLEGKMKELKEQVSSLKKEISDLDEENGKIELNVGHLEAMKAGKTPQIAPKPRAHNSKKVIKLTK